MAPQNRPYRRKNLADISYTSRVITNFVSNFVAMATGIGRAKCDFLAFNGPFPKPPCKRSNHAHIADTDEFIANFVLNFVAMATKVIRRLKMRLVAFKSPSRKTPH